MAMGEMAYEWARIPGPVDRVSFFQEQRRNRRKTRRAALWCAVIVGLMGLGLSAIVMPIIVLFLHSAANASVVRLSYFVQHGAGASGKTTEAAVFLVIAAAWFLPGLIAVLLLWLLLRRLYKRSADALATTIIGARPPQPSDLKEQQLGNIVQELAIAAGINAPKVVVLDNAPPNAGISGASPDDATLIVSRSMLDEFDRDQIMGAMAIVVASVANGDLYVLYNTLSLFEAFGVVLAIISLPFSPASRRACSALLKLALLSRGQAETVGDLLLQNAHGSGMEDMNRFMRSCMSGNFLKPLLGGFVILLLLPWIFMAIFAYMIVTLVPLMFCGPLLALEWRDRRHLADATAVQLTRNPGAVAKAVMALVENGGTVEGQRWSDLLFIVGKEIFDERAERKFFQGSYVIEKSLAGGPLLRRLKARMKNYAEMQADMDSRMLERMELQKQKKSLEGKLGIVGTFHPSINSRMLRLRALGADVQWPYRREYPVWILVAALFLIFAFMFVGAFYQLLVNPH